MSRAELNDLKKELQSAFNRQSADLESFLADAIKLIRSREGVLEELFQSSRTQKYPHFNASAQKLLIFIAQADPKKFAVGAVGHDFIALFAKLLNDPAGKASIDFFEKLLDTIRESLLFCSSQICPQCHADLLHIYKDERTHRLYEHCPSCFFAQSDRQIERLTEDCFPANLDILTEEGFLEKSVKPGAVYSNQRPAAPDEKKGESVGEV